MHVLRGRWHHEDADHEDTYVSRGHPELLRVRRLPLEEQRGTASKALLFCLLYVRKLLWEGLTGGLAFDLIALCLVRPESGRNGPRMCGLYSRNTAVYVRVRPLTLLSV